MNIQMVNTQGFVSTRAEHLGETTFFLLKVLDV
jgi:hypothetical protein